MPYTTGPVPSSTVCQPITVGERDTWATAAPPR